MPVSIILMPPRHQQSRKLSNLSREPAEDLAAWVSSPCQAPQRHRGAAGAAVSGLQAHREDGNLRAPSSTGEGASSALCAWVQTLSSLLMDPS